MNRRTFFGWLIKAAIAAPMIPSILEASVKTLPGNCIFSGELGVWHGAIINHRQAAKEALKVWMAEEIDNEIFSEISGVPSSMRGDRITFTKIPPLAPPGAHSQEAWYEGQGRG